MIDKDRLNFIKKEISNRSFIMREGSFIPKSNLTVIEIETVFKILDNYIEIDNEF